MENEVRYELNSLKGSIKNIATILKELDTRIERLKRKRGRPKGSKTRRSQPKNRRKPYDYRAQILFDVFSEIDGKRVFVHSEAFTLYHTLARHHIPSMQGMFTKVYAMYVFPPFAQAVASIMNHPVDAPHVQDLLKKTPHYIYYFHEKEGNQKKEATA